MAKSEILKTTDYSIFKLKATNREINQNNLTMIIESIRSQNLLHLRHIDCDAEMNVIDGQHRLRAAQELNLPIYYRIDESLSDDHMKRLNQASHIWNINDYLNFYARRGNENYIKLEKFIAQNNMKVRSALCFFGIYHHTRKDDKGPIQFQNGGFKFPDDIRMHEINEMVSSIQEVKRFINQKFIGKKAFINQTSFMKALIGCLNLKEFSFDTFMDKLAYRLDIIRPCMGVNEYIKLFKTIYNWKNQEPIAI